MLKYQIKEWWSVPEDKNEIQSSEQQSIDEATNINIKDKTEIQDESKPSFFHVTRRYKWIFSLSVLILIVTSILIYAKYNNVLGAEYWQMAIWGVCGILSFYAIIKKSLSALILNLLLFLGISLIPAWGLVYMFFKPILELLTGTKLPEWRQPHYW